MLDRPNQPEAYQNSLDDISQGVQEFLDGKVAYYKITYQD
jgi:hypothetical protein